MVAVPKVLPNGVACRTGNWRLHDVANVGIPEPEPGI